MRETFVHQAVIRLSTGSDAKAVGGAVTMALCGSWDHDPPCPLAPHHTATIRSDGEVRVRILFAAELDQEMLVRGRIDRALAVGALLGPDGVTTHWQLLDSRSSRVHAAEFDHARRLLGSQAAPGTA